MKRSKRLEVVLNLAQDAENSAAEVFEMANRLVREDTAKLHELNVYYNDYESIFSQSANVVRAEDIARQRGFLIQLANAKVQQAEVIAQRERVAELKKSIWQKAHLKRRAVGDLIQRLKSDEDKDLSKKEEKMLDEWFLQTSSSRTQNSVF